MVAEGLVTSRARAQALIADGSVMVAGTVVRKPGARTDGTITVTADPMPWVSRAARKLIHALTEFALAPSGIALDLGASTGGFVQVLLANGADNVHAVDVGHGQLHPQVAADPRVIVHEGINARDLPKGLLPPPDWITADLSFISLEKALPPALELARTGATLVALIKPQFEAGRAHIGKGGIVRDPIVHQLVCARIRDFLVERGWQVIGLTASPITGSDGNREFLIAAQKA